MEEFTFKDCNYNWLKEKDLKCGYLYIIKDGRLALYLGKTVDNLFCFYICCNIRFKNISSTILSFANYDIQLNALLYMCKELMNHKVFIESIFVLKGLPKIYCEFPFLNFKDTYKTWYSKSKMVLDNLPVLSEITGQKSDSGYVKSKDLVPGTLYYTGECWRSEYVYLGRTSDKRYVWYFIGNEDILIKTPANLLLSKAETTKNNKKVKLLFNALNDRYAYVSDGCKKLIRMKFKVDMSCVTQDMLDRVR